MDFKRLRVAKHRPFNEIDADQIQDVNIYNMRMFFTFTLTDIYFFFDIFNIDFFHLHMYIRSEL